MNKPADRTAEIEIWSPKCRRWSSRTPTIFTEVTDIFSQFDCSMTEINLLKEMAKKTKNTTYIKMIYDEMDATSPSFQKACPRFTSFSAWSMSQTRPRRRR